MKIKYFLFLICTFLSVLFTGTIFYSQNSKVDSAGVYVEAGGKFNASGGIINSSVQHPAIYIEQGGTTENPLVLSNLTIANNKESALEVRGG